MYYIYNYTTRVAVTRSKDVASFGPPLPANATFPKGPTFSEFLLAKSKFYLSQMLKGTEVVIRDIQLAICCALC